MIEQRHDVGVAQLGRARPGSGPWYRPAGAGLGPGRRVGGDVAIAVAVAGTQRQGQGERGNGAMDRHG